MANMIPIQTVTVGSAATNIIFTNIPQTYTDLKLVVSARMNYGSGFNYSRFVINSDSTTSLTTFRNIATEGSSTVSSYTQAAYGAGGETFIGGAPGTSPIFNNFEIYIPNYGASVYKSYYIDLVNASTLWNWVSSHVYANTTPITSLKLSNSYDFAQYTTATLYGIRKY